MNGRSGRPWPRTPAGVPVLRFLLNLPNFARLYWRLLKDRRVSLWPKALLVLSAVYVVSPVDFIPDLLPFVGEIDDLMVLGFACWFFVQLCPTEVVREHVARIDAGT
ncbi:MAG: DUF1232 domain-containing protein [Deltaproteobacteria bacterium]|nr:DUF1232 domain-containing protein [Deltaproteobacteria bacterium]